VPWLGAYNIARYKAAVWLCPRCSPLRFSSRFFSVFDFAFSHFALCVVHKPVAQKPTQTRTGCHADNVAVDIFTNNVHISPLNVHIKLFSFRSENAILLAAGKLLLPLRATGS
jgi:hypothetical protein